MADDEVPEFNEDDNRDFRVLDVSTIPDLVVTSGQVSIDPRLPRSGDVVHFEVTVLNTGDQTASDIEVELGIADGAVIDTATIPTIEGGGVETVWFEWATDGVVGDTALRIAVDPSDSVEELDEDNNTVDLMVTVQDADLWVTERFISPNGDGIKDATTIFVRDGVTSIEVVDPWGETVAVLDVDPSGQAVWNGRKADGAAVRDGHYELVADGLRSWVEVDLNATTITDDISQPLDHRIGAQDIRPLGCRVHVLCRVTRRRGRLSDRKAQQRLWRPQDVAVERRAPRGRHRLAGGALDDPPDVGAGRCFRHLGLRRLHIRIFAASLPGSCGRSSSRPGAGRQTPPVARWRVDPVGQPLWWYRPTDHFAAGGCARRDLEFGPYSPGAIGSWNYQTTVHWSPNGDRAVVTMHAEPPWVPGDVGLALDIDAGNPPTVRELHLDQSCGGNDFANGPAPVSASVDFDNNLLLCTRDLHRDLHIIDLDDRIDHSIGRSSGGPQPVQRSCTA